MLVTTDNSLRIIHFNERPPLRADVWRGTGLLFFFAISFVTSNSQLENEGNVDENSLFFPASVTVTFLHGCEITDEVIQDRKGRSSLVFFFFRDCCNNFFKFVSH